MRIIYRWVNDDEPLHSIKAGSVSVVLDESGEVVEVHAPSGSVAVRHDEPMHNTRSSTDGS